MTLEEGIVDVGSRGISIHSVNLKHGGHTMFLAQDDLEGCLLLFEDLPDVYMTPYQMRVVASWLIEYSKGGL